MGNRFNFYILASSDRLSKTNKPRDPHSNYLQNVLYLTPWPFPVQAVDPLQKVLCHPVCCCSYGLLENALKFTALILGLFKLFQIFVISFLGFIGVTMGAYDKLQTFSSSSWKTMAMPVIRTTGICPVMFLLPICEIWTKFNGGNFVIMAIELLPFKIHYST